MIAQEKKRKPLEFGSKDDFQLAQAINHLKGLPVQVSKVQPDMREDTSDDKAAAKGGKQSPQKGEKK